MGKNKALLSFDSSHHYLDQLVNVYHRANIDEIKIVCQKPLPKIHIDNKISSPGFIINDKPNLGRGYYISLGLQALKNIDQIFVQNIDNPFTSTALINKMLSESDKNKSVVPAYHGKKGHPILIASSIAKYTVTQKDFLFNFKTIVAQFPQKLIDWEYDNILANINTMDAYNKWHL